MTTINKKSSTLPSRTVNVILSVDTNELSLLGLSLVFVESKFEVNFKEYKRRSCIRQTKSIIATLGSLYFLAFLAFGNEDKVSSWRVLLFSNSVVSFLVYLVLSIRNPRVLRDKVRAQFHNILVGLVIYYFVSLLWCSLFNELQHSYELRCEAEFWRCPNSFWNIRHSTHFLGMLVVANNCLGLLFHHAVYLNLALLTVLLPTLFPWYEKTDSQGRRFTVNNVDASILITFSVTVLVMAITLRRCFINERLHRLQYKQLHELNIFRRVKMILMDSMLPSRLQKPALTPRDQASSSSKQFDFADSFQPVVEEFPHVTVLFCRFGENKMDQFDEPEEFVHTVARCVTAFDQMVQTSQMFKVEHVGDTYLVSSPEVAHGPDSKHSTHEDRRQAAVALLKLGEEFVKLGRRMSRRCGHKLGFSASVHSGPALGVILGQTRRFYRLMGETVQTVGDMARKCPTGQVMVSASTKTLLEGTPFSFVESYLDCPLGRGKSTLEAEFNEAEKASNESDTVVFYLDDVSDHEALFPEFSSMEHCLLMESKTSGLGKELVGNEWIWALWAEASCTLNRVTARFRVERIEALYKHETRDEIRRSAANTLDWLMMSHFVYFMAMLASMIWSGSEWQILVGTVSVGFCAQSMLLGIRIWMVRYQKDDAASLSISNWLMNAVCLCSMVAHVKTCPNYFSFTQSTLLVTVLYDQEGFVPFMVFLFVHGSCYIPLYVTEHSIFFASLKGLVFIVGLSIGRVAVLGCVCRDANLLRRINWMLDDLLKRRHSELDSLLVDLIPSSSAREFMIEQKLPSVDLSFISYNVCCIWMSSTRVQAVILSTQVMDFCTIATVLDPVQTAFWLHDIWSVFDMCIQECEKENEWRKDKHTKEDIKSDCPFKLGIVDESYAVVGLADSSTEKSLVCIARKMVQLASQLSKVVDEYMNLPLLHEYIECGVRADMRLGLAHGKVTLAAVGEIQPRLQVYDTVMKLASQMQKQSQPGWVTLSEDLARLLQYRTQSFPIDELHGLETQRFHVSESVNIMEKSSADLQIWSQDRI